jgi:hypothetical protein
MVDRLSLSPQTQKHCSQELPEFRGNLDGHLPKAIFFNETLTFLTELCLIQEASALNFDDTGVYCAII